ncbi:lanthionine synthetase C family protein [Aspergillus saccharolyticus JOP 1030-1]|uniref:Lanthionine synthetase C family protein n=1 Tax=Aspergillus saccharolyticus JOP 1030-1 TaxID=1450539 RepID=A0A318ZQA6_9EURO|nr:lanthionine synthetase C family protein [Aspergillus saccharolyticus JOP 1030-1]PYH46130.1 lanthionine synthetase C family protein [Aspergillus saccharolyticus JOP 1030-1]
MATANAPQFYANQLSPVEISQSSLKDTLKQLQTAVRKATLLLHESCPRLEALEESQNTGFYAGIPGVILAFLRLDHQAKFLGSSDLNFYQLAIERIPTEGPDVPILHDRTSPFGSSSALAGPILRISASKDPKTTVSSEDIECIRRVVHVALENDRLVRHGASLMGSDEMLFGRAGLLWALLNLRMRNYEDETARSLNPIFREIPRLVDAIIVGGIDGRKDFTTKHGEQDALQLMWHWKTDRYSLGAVHGIAGILSSILACKAEELNNGAERNHLPLIAGTITGLCKLCIANYGHLPTSLPLHGSSHRSSSLVQVCHGSPGFLNLMACARRNRPLVTAFWQPEWDKAIYAASERVWEEGILSKGGGICHGIAGNAWSLLLLDDSFEEDIMATARQKHASRTESLDLAPGPSGPQGEYILARALALLLKARDTPPYNDTDEDSSCMYRMPDRPYSLAEGLAGTVCAWANACVVIHSKLQSMHVQQGQFHSGDVTLKEYESLKLAIPILASHRPTGLL